MIVCDLGRAALLVSVPIAYLFDALTFPQLYAVAFGAGTLSVLFNVSDASLFQTIVPRDRFVEASSLLNGSRAFSFVAGPTVAGFLVRAVSAPGALVADALSFLCSGALLGRIRPASRRRTATQDGITVGPSLDRRIAARQASLLATATINFSTSSSGRCSSSTRPARSGCRRDARARARRGRRRRARRVGRSHACLPRIGIGPTLLVGCFVFSAPFLLVPLAGGPEPVVLLCLFLAELGSASA
jgi:hypothetical protein